MRLKMAKNSLFAILLRSPWWISLVIAATLAVIGFVMMPRESAFYGLSLGLPFLIVGLVAAYQQRSKPSPARVERTIQAITAMSSAQFVDIIAKAFRSNGFEVTQHAGPAADLELKNKGRTALVSCKRWKAAGTGIEPLRALHAAVQESNAQESFYIGTGSLTENAEQFARQHRIRVLQAQEITQLLKPVLPKS